MPGLREAILDLLLQAGAGTTTPLAQRLIAQGFARSVNQVWRAINDLDYEGFIGIRLGDEWFLSDQGKVLAEQRRRGPRLAGEDAPSQPSTSHRCSPSSKALRDRAIMRSSRGVS
jgi:hypothetical protein